MAMIFNIFFCLATKSFQNNSVMNFKILISLSSKKFGNRKKKTDQ
jgi:hypothetical protein